MKASYLYDLYKSKVFMAESRSSVDFENAQSAWNGMVSTMEPISLIIVEVGGRKRKITRPGHISTSEARELLTEKFGHDYIDLTFEHSYKFKKGQEISFKVSEILPLAPYFIKHQVISESGESLSDFDNMTVVDVRFISGIFTIIAK